MSPEGHFKGLYKRIWLDVSLKYNDIFFFLGFSNKEKY